MENGRAVKRQFREIRTPAPSCKPGVDRILQAAIATTLVAGWKGSGLMTMVCLSRVRTKGKALRKHNDWTQLPQGHRDSQHLGCVVDEREIKNTEIVEHKSTEGWELIGSLGFTQRLMFIREQGKRVPRCSPGRHWASKRLGVWRAMSTQQPSRVPCSDLTLDCNSVNEDQKILSWLSGNVDTVWGPGNVNPLHLDLWMDLQNASGSIYEQAVLGDHVGQCYLNVKVCYRCRSKVNKW